MAAETAPDAGKSVLAIDAGNTRIKWGVHDGTGWLTQPWIETAGVAGLKTALADLSALSTIVVSNVAGVALREQLELALPATARVRWIESKRAQCGVRSAYAAPAQLGSDRWAALIGARRMFGTAAVVVNAGTALTVDALTGDGVFAGGVIAPGVDLMRKALAGNTDALLLQAGGFKFFPDTTGDGIMSGAINASCGAIERMARFLSEAGDATPLCVLSGGGAALIAAHLNLEVKVVDNLVLEGLLTISREA